MGKFSGDFVKGYGLRVRRMPLCRAVYAAITEMTGYQDNMFKAEGL
jgi:hypothetical protein